MNAISLIQDIRKQLETMEFKVYPIGPEYAAQAEVVEKLLPQLVKLYKLDELIERHVLRMINPVWLVQQEAYMAEQWGPSEKSSEKSYEKSYGGAQSGVGGGACYSPSGIYDVVPYRVTMTAEQVRAYAKTSLAAEQQMRQQCPSAFTEVVTLSPGADGFYGPYRGVQSAAVKLPVRDIALAVYPEFNGPYKGRGLHLESHYRWRIVDAQGLGQTLIAERDI